jgi:hypothetical protein
MRMRKELAVQSVMIEWVFKFALVSRNGDGKA